VNTIKAGYISDLIWILRKYVELCLLWNKHIGEGYENNDNVQLPSIV